MPAVRPYWKGYIKLALVSCPIGLWAASSSSERVAFRQINKKTGSRLRQSKADSSLLGTELFATNAART